MSSRALGILQILASGFCFGFLGLFGKFAYAHGLTPGEFLSFRFLGAAAVIGLWLALAKPGSLRLDRSVIGKSLLLGILGYAVFSSCFFQALTGLSVSLTVLLLYTYPIFVTLGARLFLNERIERTGVWALPLALLGLILLVANDLRVEHASALLFGLGSAIFYSVYILLARLWLKAVDPFAAIFYIQAGAGGVLGLLHLRDLPHSAALATTAALPLLGAVVISTVLAMGLFLAGLAKLPSSQASILSTAEPITGILVAALILGERLTHPQALGGALVLTALVLISRDKTA